MATATRTQPENGTAPASVVNAEPTLTPRQVFGQSVEDAALALGKPVRPGLTPEQAEHAYADRARNIAKYRQVFGDADPSWSTRCDDSIDRAPMVMLAYLIGCRADSKARTTTIKRLAEHAAARQTA